MDDRWDGIGAARRVRQPNDFVLDWNGWQALIAYLAGPGLAAADQDPLDVPHQPEYRQIISDSVRDYLADWSITPPPDDQQGWLIALPEGVTAGEFSIWIDEWPLPLPPNVDAAATARFQSELIGKLTGG